MVLTKLTEGAVRAEALPSGVSISTLDASPLVSLHATLASVYGPLLKSGAVDVDDKLQVGPNPKP